MAYSAPSSGLHVTPGSSLSALCSFSARRFSDASSSLRSFAYSSYDGSPSCAMRGAPPLRRKPASPGVSARGPRALCAHSGRDYVPQKGDWKGAQVNIGAPAAPPLLCNF